MTSSSIGPVRPTALGDAEAAADARGLTGVEREDFVRGWMETEAEFVEDALVHGGGPFGEE